jgi:hypothetical protein
MADEWCKLFAAGLLRFHSSFVLHLVDDGKHEWLAAG